jgi:leader peptidase (prepilin peptidase)/N-methyltransferase
MPETIPREALLAWWGLLGLFVGSFLNVAIARYPDPELSVSHPRRSRCPSCGHQLTWKENLPLFSWAAQLGRCRSCKWRIPVRYPLVELLTGAIYLLVALETPQGELPLLAVRLLVISGLILATFVDLDCFEIPDSVSKGGMVLGPLLAMAVPELFADSPVAARFATASGEVGAFGALTASLLGLVVGGGILLAIGWLGDRMFGRESMGFGDVKLLAAGGGFIGAGGVIVALMIGSLLASVAGLGNMLRLYALTRARARARGIPRSHRRASAFARARGRYLPFGPYLAAGVGIALLYWNEVLELVL